MASRWFSWWYKEFNSEFSYSDNLGISTNIIEPGIGSELNLYNSNSIPAQDDKTTATKETKPELQWWDEIKEKSQNIKKKNNLANEATAVSNALSDKEKADAAKLSNLSVVFNSKEYFDKKKISEQVYNAKLEVCKNYINKYLKTAKEEAEIFNIPVSITLAQGLLESNAGESKMSIKENNHFGIKCVNKCIGCRCANYTDDDKYDMFRIFDSPWYSFREHSILLNNSRYKHLTKLNRTDYKNWARGLKTAGYATDKNYADKLIKIIEYFKLHQYDHT